MVEPIDYFDLLNVLNSVMGLAVNVFLQVLSFRYFPSLSLLKSIYGGFIVGYMALFVTQVSLFYFSPGKSPSRDFGGMIVANSLIYFSLGYCYFHFLNLGETARRIRILRELQDAGNGLAMDEILSRYNAKSMVAMRLERLLNSGQVKFVHNRYFIKKPLLLMSAKIIAFLKLMIIGKKLGEG